MGGNRAIETIHSIIWVNRLCNIKALPGVEVLWKGLGYWVGLSASGPPGWSQSSPLPPTAAARAPGASPGTDRERNSASRLGQLGHVIYPF